jgi:hypothetical protein
MRAYRAAFCFMLFAGYPGTSFGLEDLSISSTAVSNFEYNGSTRRIFPSLRNNSDLPSQWQFRYDPLYLPEVDKDGTIQVIKTLLPDNSVRIQVPILIDDKKARDLAFRQLKLAFKEQSEKLQPANVFALNVGTITVSMNFEGLNFGAKLVDQTTSFQVPTDSFSINIVVPSQDDATNFLKLLPTLGVQYQVSYSAKQARQNNIRIKYSDLKNSALYATLNGLGTTEVYVQRDDMRNLAEDMHTQIDIVGVLEAPSQFDAELAERIVNLLGTPIAASMAQFDAEKWQATYNGKDLSPDEITNSLNKELLWDEGSQAFKFSGSIDTGGKVALLDILSAEGKMGGSYNQDQLKTWLKKHDVEISFVGDKIVAKSIGLKRVNLANFSSSSQFSSVMTVVSDQVNTESGSINFGLLLASNVSGTSIPGRVTEPRSSS